MRLPAGIRPFRSLQDVAGTIADLARAISAGWNIEHNTDGTHKFSWVDIAHDSTRYTGDGTMTWAVESVDQALLSYRVAGDSCLFAWRIVTGTVGGVVANRLYIRLPDGIRPSRRVSGVHYYDDSGTEGIGLARLDSTLTKVELFKTNSGSNWTAGSTHYTEGTLEFPITQ